jgi:hypothetical protein
VPVSHVTAIMPFTAAALGTARTVRERLQPPHLASALEALHAGTNLTPSHPCHSRLPSRRFVACTIP